MNNLSVLTDSGLTDILTKIKNYFSGGSSPLDSYPVGSIYISVNSSSPASLFGGTWQQIQDTFLLACGSTYAADSTGGEATHTLTVNEIPSHTHQVTYVLTKPGIATGTASERNLGYSTNYVDTQSTGGSAAHNNMPPYLAVYMWKRTA